MKNILRGDIMKIKITADSTCDLSPEIIEKYNIDIFPLYVILGDDGMYRDGVDIKPHDIFDYVAKTEKLPKTSAVPTEEYAEKFGEILKDYDAIIHFDISSKASSTNSNAILAAKRFDGKVFVVDTLALSTGQGLLVLKACELVKENRTPQEIVDTVNALRPKVNTSFVPDSLEYLHKGGRCSLTALIGAKILKIHPMISMKDGQMYPAKKYMGSMERSLKNYISDLVAQYPKYDKSRCFITHSHCEPEVVAKVKEIVKQQFNFDEIIETFAGCVVTSHCGKGTLGVLFISE